MQLSKRTGIPQSTISTAEREGHGSRETPVYAHACGVSALWLANNTGAMIDEQIALPASAVVAIEPAANHLTSLDWLLNQITDPLERRKVSHRAAAIILDAINGVAQASATPQTGSETPSSPPPSPLKAR